MSFPIPKSLKGLDLQISLAKSPTPNFPILIGGWASIPAEATCVGQMAFIWTSDLR
jgi:hypothetical protein